jgi:catechol 2,3-dioxygenase-like lactoylglutathione lyase family enzyme
MQIQGLDHLVLTVTDMAQTLAFYTQHLGMTEVTFGKGRKALAFGAQQINLHVAGTPFIPHARLPTPGAADLCFLVEEAVAELALQLRDAGVTIELGPVPRTGACGPLSSIYVRDPDGNLIELANRQD